MCFFWLTPRNPNPPISAISPWTGSPDIEKLVQQSDFMVVMPDGGKAGFYSDWQAGSRWETFHTTELPSLLIQQYRASTLAAVAGVSMGGLGEPSTTTHGDPTAIQRRVAGLSRLVPVAR
jgi:hypothetical protein